MTLPRVQGSKFWSMLGEASTGAGSSLLQGWAEGKQRDQQRMQLDNLRRTLGQEYNIPESLLGNLDAKSLKSIAEQQAKEAPKRMQREQEAKSGAMKALEVLQDAKNSFGQTIGYEGVVPNRFATSEYIKAKDMLDSVRKNPYIKKAGITIPSIDTGSGLPAAIEKAQEQLANYYKLIPDQETQQQPQQQAQQQAGPQRLPEELKQPKSVQDLLGNRESDKPTENALLRLLGSSGMSYGLARHPIAGGIVSASDIAQTYQPGASERLQQALPSEQEIENFIKDMPKEKADRFRESYEKMRENAAPKEDKILNNLPSRENIRKWTKSITGGDYLTPKTGLDKTINSIADRIGGLNLFSNSSVLRNIAGGIAGEVGKNTAKALDLGPVAEMIADVGFTMMADPIFSKLHDKVKEQSGKIFNEVKEKIKGRVVPVKDLNTTIGTINNTLERSKDAPAQSLRKQLSSLEEMTSYGRLDMGEIRKEVEALNGWWNREGAKNADAKLRDFFQEAKSAAEKVIEDGLSKHVSPKLAKDYSKAKQAWAGIKEAEKAINAVKKAAAKGDYKSAAIKSLFSKPGAKLGTMMGYALGGGRVGAGVVGTAGSGVDKVIDFYKLLKLPFAKENFIKLAPEAFSNNAPAIARRLTNIDNFALKQEQKKR